MSRLRLVLGLCTALLAPAAAQAENGVFESYETLRAELDGLIKTRRIADVMLAFGASDEMTGEQLADLEARVQRVYPEDFERVQVLKVDQMAGGWRQELLVYWTGLDYLYIHLLIHERGSETVAVTFNFNSDFQEINRRF